MRPLSSLTDETLAERQRRTGSWPRTHSRGQSASLTPHEGGSAGKKLRLKTEALNERRGQRMKRVSIRSVAISCFLFAAPSFAAADKALCSSDDAA